MQVALAASGPVPVTSEKTSPVAFPVATSVQRGGSYVLTIGTNTGALPDWVSIKNDGHTLIISSSCPYADLTLDFQDGATIKTVEVSKGQSPVILKDLRVNNLHGGLSDSQNSTFDTLIKSGDVSLHLDNCSMVEITSDYKPQDGYGVSVSNSSHIDIEAQSVLLDNVTAFWLQPQQSVVSRGEIVITDSQGVVGDYSGSTLSFSNSDLKKADGAPIQHNYPPIAEEGAAWHADPYWWVRMSDEDRKQCVALLLIRSFMSLTTL